MQKNDEFASKGAAFEASEDVPTNTNLANTFGKIAERRYGRRDVMRGALGLAATTALSGTLGTLGGIKTAEAADGRYVWTEIEHGVDETHHVAPGHTADILIRWGDPIFADSPEFDPMKQTAAAQARQFGYNNDFLGYVGLPFGSDNPDNGLLCVNHEYTSEEVMFPGIGRQDNKGFPDMTAELVDIEMAAHGGSVIEVKREGEKWSVVKDSQYNRRITANTTYMELTGPAAGHDRLKTSVDQNGTTCIGTFNNCAGGITPWGTYLMAEENFHGYFGGAVDGHPEERNYKRYGVPGGWYAWSKYHKRFDINAEPNEANRFGWVVEVDAMDPTSTPKKRTAMGRFKHEGAEPIVNGDGRVVVYMGDDQRFDYVYKFVSERRYNPDDRAANMDILDDGTLFVARFNEDGKLDWLPLIYGSGPLTAENGFHSQADVVIEARIAADLLGATPMDRPEDIDPNPQTNKVYVMLTNNSKRKADAVDAANPRGPNDFGQIVEMVPPNGDHDALQYTWDLLVVAGDPSKPEVGAKYHQATSENGWFGSPDNCTVDAAGRLWISTDQGSGWSKTGNADGLYGLETEGEMRGYSKMFFRTPIGAELCGPRFTPDVKSLFLAVQHPATDGTKDFPGFERNSTFEDPATRWPDFTEGMPPRPSVVVVRKDDGGEIGT
ncbi:PhoX family phosphatase [Pelagibius litoralis]|uniref:PhoX family phosphatase n=1 Tax=Pelagibius litoralis TaxID=374515 RepID=A0A967C4B9_9PROT|nr:PhoX family phosphatase [Pelagibius litoralis]NIA68485.1 PhoX family phosphatase [Pelagibius litoralis]